MKKLSYLLMAAFLASFSYPAFAMDSAVSVLDNHSTDPTIVNMKTQQEARAEANVQDLRDNDEQAW